MHQLYDKNGQSVLDKLHDRMDCAERDLREAKKLITVLEINMNGGSYAEDE